MSVCFSDQNENAEPIIDTIPLVSEGDATTKENINTNSEEDLISNHDDTNSNDISISNENSNNESNSSFAQHLTTQSGRRIIKPKHYIQVPILRFLSTQSSIDIKNLSYIKSLSIFRAQMDYQQELYSLRDKTLNHLHPLSCIVLEIMYPKVLEIMHAKVARLTAG